MASHATGVAKGVLLGLVFVFAIIGFVGLFLVPHDSRTEAERYGDCLSREMSALKIDDPVRKKKVEEQLDRYCAEFRNRD